MNEKKFDAEALARKPVGELSDGEAAHLYRLAQMRKALSLFEDAHRRAATTTQEFNEWFASPTRQGGFGP